MEYSCSIANESTLLAAEVRHGALLWLGTFGRDWQQVYERYHKELAMLVVVHLYGTAFKATVLSKVTIDHLSQPWWVETFIGGLYQDRLDAVGQTERHMANLRRESQHFR